MVPTGNNYLISCVKLVSCRYYFISLIVYLLCILLFSLKSGENFHSFNRLINMYSTTDVEIALQKQVDYVDKFFRRGTNAEKGCFLFSRVLLRR
jgi:hypothetical protein